MHFDYTNLSAPLPAEMYVDFGVLGVCLIPILIGIALKTLDRGAQHVIVNGHPFGSRLLYGGVIGFSVILCRGALLAVSGPIYLYFGIAYLCFRLQSRGKT